MAVDRQIYDFYPHTVTIKAFASKNNYGENTHGASRTARAYVEPTQALNMGNTIDEETRPRRAYINDLSITLRDQITLPDGSAPEITTVETHTEVLGIEHTVVTFK